MKHPLHQNPGSDLAFDQTASVARSAGEYFSRRKFLGRMAAWAVTMRGMAPLIATAAGSKIAVPSQAALSYYARPAALDDGGVHRAFLAGLPAEPEKLVAAIQEMMLHQHWAPAYGETLTAKRREEPHLRGVQDMLACLHDRIPLGTGAASPANRLVGVCRHFTMLAVAAHRARGMPARARCGFAAYFTPGKFEDHWVAECWSEREGRWRLIDAQLDGLQRKKLGIGFDPLDRFQRRRTNESWLTPRTQPADDLLQPLDKQRFAFRIE